MVFQAGVVALGSRIKPTGQGVIEVVVDGDSALWRVGTATQYPADDGRLVYKIVLDSL
jgi:hypothetical protein